MKGRYQRSPLAPCSHIPASEIGDHIDTCQLGQQRRIVELQGVACAIEGARLMTHRLTMRTNGDHLGFGGAGCLNQTGNDVCVNPDQRIGRQGGSVQFIGAGTVERQQLLGQGLRQRRIDMRQHHRAFSR